MLKKIENEELLTFNKKDLIILSKELECKTIVYSKLMHDLAHENAFGTKKIKNIFSKNNVNKNDLIVSINEQEYINSLGIINIYEIIEEMNSLNDECKLILFLKYNVVL